MRYIRTNAPLDRTQLLPLLPLSSASAIMIQGNRQPIPYTGHSGTTVLFHRRQG